MDKKTEVKTLIFNAPFIKEDDFITRYFLAIKFADSPNDLATSEKCINSYDHNERFKVFSEGQMADIPLSGIGRENSRKQIIFDVDDDNEKFYKFAWFSEAAGYINSDIKWYYGEVDGKSNVVDISDVTFAETVVTENQLNNISSFLSR